MTAPILGDVVLDIETWIARLRGLGMSPQTRYSQTERSVYLYLPIYMEKAVYPPEFLEDLESVGIIKRIQVHQLLTPLPLT
jgi:hypothetical protein